MINEWLGHCRRLSVTPADFYHGARKIIRGPTATFTDFSKDLSIADAGFTASKLTMLRRLYLHEESIAAAKFLWDLRVSKRKYGSVSFHTYNHYIKSNPDKKSKRASVMGPCIQSVVLTYLSDHVTEIDIFYRTTEFFKKFPADLVFIRDELLPRFDFKKAPLKLVKFHFANLTMHPMYFVTTVPLVQSPTHELELMRVKDKYFWQWVVKWSARYICPEHSRGIQKFSQALRVQKDVLSRIDKPTLTRLRQYLRDYHPGHRNAYDSDEED